MIMIDAAAMAWMIAAVVWGLAFAEIIIVASYNWWRIRRWIAASWAAIPPVAAVIT